MILIMKINEDITRHKNYGDRKLNYLVPCPLETFQTDIVQIKAT